MAKILLIAVAFVAMFWLLRNHRRRTGRDAQPSVDTRAEDMVACAQCGVHLPRGEGIMSGPRYFCSEEHEQKFGKTH